MYKADFEKTLKNDNFKWLTFISVNVMFWNAFGSFPAEFLFFFTTISNMYFFVDSKTFPVKLHHQKGISMRTLWYLVLNSNRQ